MLCYGDMGNMIELLKTRLENGEQISSPIFVTRGSICLDDESTQLINLTLQEIVKDYSIEDLVGKRIKRLINSYLRFVESFDTSGSIKTVEVSRTIHSKGSYVSLIDAYMEELHISGAKVVTYPDGTDHLHYSYKNYRYGLKITTKPRLKVQIKSTIIV